MEREGIPRPVLHGDVGQFGPAREVEVIDPAGEGPESVGALEAVHDRHLAVLAADDQRVRENRCARAFDPVENLDGNQNLGGGRDIEKRPARNPAFV